MAETLLDGSDADIDFEIDYQSYKCSISSFAFQLNRRSVVRPSTFCSSNWEGALNGMKSARWAAKGFAAKGSAASVFGQYHMTDSYPVVSATLSSGCSVAMSSVVEDDNIGDVAADLATRELAGRNHNDDLSIAWVDS